MRLREVRRGSEAVRLQEQPFQLLALMLERPGDVVTREDIRQRLWPDGTSVDFEHSVNAVVKRLRAVLGDDATQPRFVETLPRQRLSLHRHARRQRAHAAPTGARASAAARRAAVHEPDRRSLARLLHRRLHRGADRPARPPLRRPHRRPGPHLGDALQGCPARRRRHRRGAARRPPGRGQRPPRRRPRAHHGAADRDPRRNPPVGAQLRPRLRATACRCRPRSPPRSRSRSSASCSRRRRRRRCRPASPAHTRPT